MNHRHHHRRPQEALCLQGDQRVRGVGIERLKALREPHAGPGPVRPLKHQKAPRAQLAVVGNANSSLENSLKRWPLRARLREFGGAAATPLGKQF